MTRRHMIAVGIALAAMLLALAQPLWIRTTGTEVAVGLRPVDPLSLFRGNYVDLNYDVNVDLPRNIDWNDPIYVVFDDARPANAIRATAERPNLGPGETCIRGRARSQDRVDFPELEQFFVTPEDGQRLERDLGNMVGIIKTTGGCRAILTSIEPTRP